MRMTFKRGFISGAFIVAAVMGVYLTFFNHPPAAVTLQANAHHSSEKMSPPKFSDDFGPPKANPDSPKYIKEKILRDKGTQHIVEVHSETLFLENDLNQNKTAPTEPDFFNLIMDTDEDFDGDKHEKKPQDIQQDPHISAETTKASEKPGDVSDDVKDIFKSVEDGGADAVPGVFGGPTTISHRDYPRFDWDKWVKDSDLVDVGTIWGYCDDPEPPEIGKVLLMKDEDQGGVKVVIVMNTTFDEPVESGLIVANVMYGEMSFFDKSMDICTLFDEDELAQDEERDTFFDCPMAAGAKYYMKELHIPFFVPSGHFTAKAKLVDQMERQIICASAEMTL